MKLDLKISWFAKMRNALDRELDREFSNIRDWWNAHDEGWRPWTKFTVLGSFALTPSTLTASGSVNETQNVILADSTSAVVTLTLPSAVGNPGRIYFIKRISAGKNLVKIATVSSQTIDGGAGYSLGWQYHSICLLSDGTNWLILF